VEAEVESGHAGFGVAPPCGWEEVDLGIMGPRTSAGRGWRTWRCGFSWACSWGSPQRCTGRT